VLGEAEMAAAVAPLPLELPLEARVLWGWRNGYVIPILSPANGTTIGCDCSVAEGEPSPVHVVWWTR
jgi:hypothetical protein